MRDTDSYQLSTDAGYNILQDSGELEVESAPYPGKILDGRYRLGNLLGRGGMGWVFEAIHLQTEKSVAIKYLNPKLQKSQQWVRLFAREARAAGRIDHPNIIRIYDVGGEGANLYLVMERLRGETLRERLNKGPVSPDEALRIMLAVIRGVSESHRHGIVHRDLKPENIMLPLLSDGTPDQPKVLDFGVSRIGGGDTGELIRTASLTGVIGTPHYMALEQLRGETVDKRVDVFAIGVIVYEMLSGSRPFTAITCEDLAVRLATEAPPPLSLDDAAMSERIDAVLQKALGRLPEDRFDSVDELASALQEAIQPMSCGAKNQRENRIAATLKATTSKRHLRILSGIILLAFILSFGLLLMLVTVERHRDRRSLSLPSADEPAGKVVGASRTSTAKAHSDRSTPESSTKMEQTVSNAPTRQAWLNEQHESRFRTIDAYKRSSFSVFTKGKSRGKKKPTRPVKHKQRTTARNRQGEQATPSDDIPRALELLREDF